MKKLIYLLVILPVILFSGCVNEDEPAIESVGPGDRCPSFSAVMADGSIITSEDLRGHRSMIVFFNTSCSDCQRELPVVQQVYERLADSDARIICIARAEEKASIEKFWEEQNLSLPYSQQPDREIYSLFATSVIPRIYILSPELIITQCWDDNPMPTYEELLNTML